MIKPVFLIITLLATLPYTFAQQAKVSWGQNDKMDKIIKKTFRGEGDDIITFTYYDNLYAVNRYDNTLNRQTFYEFKDLTKYTDWLDVLNLGGSICLFSGKEDKDAKQYNYYVQKLNGKTLKPEGPGLLLGSMKTKKLHADPIVDLVYSEDSSKLLFLCAAADYKDENELYTIAVINSDRQLLWQKAVELPYESHRSEKITSYVTNAGEVGIPVNVYNKNIIDFNLHAEGANIPDYQTKLMLVSKDAKAPVEVPVEVGGKFLHTLQLAKDGKERTLFGLYKNKSDGNIAGYFTTQLAEGATSLKIDQLHDFPADLLALLDNDEQGSNKKSDPGLSMFFYLRDILVRSNGTTDYVLQWTRSNYYLGTPDFRGVGGRQFPTNLNTGATSFGDVIDIAIDKNNKAILTRVPRRMQTEANLFGEVLLTTYQNKLVLFYNENNETLGQPMENKPSMLHNISKSAFVITTIDEKGKINRSVVYQNNDLDISTGVKVSKKLTGNRFALYGGGGALSRYYQMGLLEIK